MVLKQKIWIGLWYRNILKHTHWYWTTVTTRSVEHVRTSTVIKNILTMLPFRESHTYLLSTGRNPLFRYETIAMYIIVHLAMLFFPPKDLFYIHNTRNNLEWNKMIKLDNRPESLKIINGGLFYQQNNVSFYISQLDKSIYSSLE